MFTLTHEEIIERAKNYKVHLRLDSVEWESFMGFVELVYKSGRHDGFYEAATQEGGNPLDLAERLLDEFGVHKSKCAIYLAEEIKERKGILPGWKGCDCGLEKGWAKIRQKRGKK